MLGCLLLHTAAQVGELACGRSISLWVEENLGHPDDTEWFWEGFRKCLTTEVL